MNREQFEEDKMGTWKLTDWETSPGATKLQKQGG